jgi:hypothetical protein
MRINNQSLQGYTATQSSTIGWKDCACGKSGTSSYQNLGCLQLAIASGNPEFYFTTFQEEMVSNNSGADIRHIGWTTGWRVNTSGTIDNPTGNGACYFIPYQYDTDSGNTDWSYWDITTRAITWRASSSAAISTTVQRVIVYSERIDLITLSCV